MAKPWQDAMDFAFFVVNFHYTRADYDALTAVEKAFIYKAYETKVVRDSNIERDAVLNAVANAHRKKGKQVQALWKKRPKKADMVVVMENINLVHEIEKGEKNWIDKIYEANGMKPPSHH